MIAGFKEFIMKGNVVDLAVAVVIGAAFSAVINSLVENIIMPLVSAIVGSPNFDSFAVVTINGNDLRFGAFITVVVNFLIIAAAIYFIVVVPMNHMIERRSRRLGIAEEEVPEDPQIILLTEIRDSIRAERH